MFGKIVLDLKNERVAILQRDVHILCENTHAQLAVEKYFLCLKKMHPLCKDLNRKTKMDLILFRLYSGRECVSFDYESSCAKTDESHSQSEGIHASYPIMN